MSFCFGQVLPTVPANIFRVTVQNYNGSQELSSRNQKFSMHGISHAYFNDTKKNEWEGKKKGGVPGEGVGRRREGTKKMTLRFGRLSLCG